MKWFDQWGFFLTSSTNQHSSNNLVVVFDVAGESRLCVIKTWNNNCGLRLVLGELNIPMDGVPVKEPFNLNSLFQEKRAALGDDTGGIDRWPQGYHRARCLDICTALHVITWKQKVVLNKYSFMSSRFYKLEFLRRIWLQTKWRMSSSGGSINYKTYPNSYPIPKVLSIVGKKKLLKSLNTLSIFSSDI